MARVSETGGSPEKTSRVWQSHYHPVGCGMMACKTGQQDLLCVNDSGNFLDTFSCTESLNPSRKPNLRS